MKTNVQINNKTGFVGQSNAEGGGLDSTLYIMGLDFGESISIESFGFISEF
jgi:hypothetical protein